MRSDSPNDLRQPRGPSPQRMGRQHPLVELAPVPLPGGPRNEGRTLMVSAQQPENEDSEVAAGKPTRWPKQIRRQTR